MQRAKKIIELAGISNHSKVLLIGVIVDLVHCIVESTTDIKLADFLLAGRKILDTTLIMMRLHD